jgi:hypothetical protein
VAKVAIYPLVLTCPACGKSGKADAREFHGETEHAVYTLQILAGPFALIESSDRPDTALVRCHCGREFHA